MSRIDELIERLCPDGVEFKDIYDICTYTRGKTITAKNANLKGDVPVVAGGQEPAYYHDEFNREGYTITIAGSGAYAGHIMLWDCPIWVSDAFTIEPQDETILSTLFLYQLLKARQSEVYALKKGSGVPHVHGQDLKRFRIPVPPMEIQAEIVRMLGSFTQLEAELEAELKARRRQYSHYRNKLLDFSDDPSVTWIRLSDLYDRFISPIRDRPKVFDGDIPWCRIEDVEGRYMSDSREGLRVSQDVVSRMNLKVYPVGTVLVACSASIGTCAITTRPLVSNQRFIGLVCGDKVRNTFLRYYIESRTNELASISSTGTIAGITRKRLDGLLVPVPSLEEQDRIVTILDMFDALSNGIGEGIPAEIEARRKQYEYYRNKLLSFKEKVA